MRYASHTRVGSVRVIDIARKATRRTMQCSPHGHRMVLGVWLDDAAQTCISGAADGDVKVCFRAKFGLDETCHVACVRRAAVVSPFTRGMGGV